MVITGPWEIGEFGTRVQSAPWATAPLPGPEGPGVSMAGGASLVLFRGSKRKDAAWRFIEYLSEPATQVRFYELTGDLPARRGAWRSPALAENRHAAAFRDQLDRVVPLPKVPEAEQIVSKVFEQGERQTLCGRRKGKDVEGGEEPSDVVLPSGEPRPLEYAKRLGFVLEGLTLRAIAEKDQDRRGWSGGQ